jgi:HK97 gp10 family phage protein
MGNVVRFEVKGLKELGDQLRAFGPNVAKNGLRTADYAGAKVVLKYAKATTAFQDDTGLLRQLMSVFRRRTPENVAMYSIGVRSSKKVTKVRRFGKKSKNRGKYTTAAPPSVYAKFLEFGTSKMEAKPWLRPAIVDHVPEVIDAIREGLKKAIDRAARKAK